ncbi:MAG: cob(I)yrinic acid a,c-diamide adenosyltransferase [Chitinophagales bacterium]|nr:cob(I)yrinic acid a,c-diamide adenosyltransferase [Chitinophagales bacterium]
MKIYTKTGDDGTTMLYGGERLLKSHIKIESYGTVDELNSFIGSIMVEIDTTDILEQLQQIQSRLFDVGTHLAAVAGKPNLILPEINEQHIEVLEQQIDEWNEQLPELKHFILPSGCKAAVQAHIARTICRRAERMVVRLNETEKVNEILIRYLNRLSDYLFVLARFLNWQQGIKENIWKAH